MQRKIFRNKFKICCAVKLHSIRMYVLYNYAIYLNKRQINYSFVLYMVRIYILLTNELSLNKS